MRRRRRQRPEYGFERNRLNATNDPIDKYLGTFVGGCGPAVGITRASTGAALYSRSTLTSQSKSSPTKALFQVKIESYVAADCSGTPLGSITAAGDSTFRQIDGSAVVGGVTVDKVTFSLGPFFPGISAATITINGVSYLGFAFGFQAAMLSKEINLVKGADFYVGDPAKPMDAQGYPTALNAVASFHKM